MRQQERLDGGVVCVCFAVLGVPLGSTAWRVEGTGGWALTELLWRLHQYITSPNGAHVCLYVCVHVCVCPSSAPE